MDTTTRFPDEHVHCPSCGLNTKITRTELYSKTKFNCPHCLYPIKMEDTERQKEPEKKTCPFRFIGYFANPMGSRSNADCQQEKCGVWSTEHNCCGFATISRGVY